LSHDVTITSIDDIFSVEEQLLIRQENATILFNVPSSASDVSVIINESDIPITPVDETTYRFNYSEGVQQNKTVMSLTYSYSKKDTVMIFEKEFNHDTTEFTITFDRQRVVSLEDINAGSIISIQIPEDQATRTSINVFTTILIVLLVVLVIVSTVYGFKKRKYDSQRNRNLESKEVLSIEKSLLMNVLKEIERKHRDQKISDETYQKLKSYYKQQTVEIMSNLED
ncbi:MAG: hypothetical protein QCI00_07420, partial [Candidatus Thermoplasmatota archaeon]|nr:hypothetical protein [Candidatus Thermoplasmatota archaeon]